MISKSYPASKSRSKIVNFTFKPFSTSITQVQSELLGYDSSGYPGEFIVPVDEPSISNPELDVHGISVGMTSFFVKPMKINHSAFIVCRFDTILFS